MTRKRLKTIAADDLFQGDASVTPHHFSGALPKVPTLAMPERGPTYSEAWRKQCELQTLHEYQRRMHPAEFTELWLLIGRARGEAAAKKLAADYRYYLSGLAAMGQ